MISQDQWAEIQARLSMPIPSAEVQWRIQGKSSPNTKVQLLAYIDARTVQERLDQVVGSGAWSFDFIPLHIDAKGVIQTGKGVLTIHGVSKSDIGTASSFEGSKGCCSDALKRAAVHWGVARELYALPEVWVTLDGQGHIPPAMLAKLRQRLDQLATEASSKAILNACQEVPERCLAAASAN